MPAPPGEGGCGGRRVAAPPGEGGCGCVGVWKTEMN